ncbi:condensation domain-containing protein [Streptomyces sp. NBC_00820]|uniref:condensation domain-containing protein n=1 Tax=Streptomyces sp. NBC_00820 TaxID=2975842 RepID=UPI002ED43342|nr:condensation domain-containing protein [Streptomyces sp. NBC_00820]
MLPLLRAVLLRTRNRSGATLLLVAHHLVFNGCSLRQFVCGPTRAVRGELDAERVEQAAAELPAWLRTVPATVLNPRPNRPAGTAFTGVRREIRLSAEHSRALDEMGSALDVSSFVLFSAVYAALLARHSATTPVVFGSPVMARRTLGSLDLCGYFVNTLPLIIDISWDQSVGAFVCKTVQAEADRVRSQAAVSFDRIVRHTSPDRNPVFSCMLAM